MSNFRQWIYDNSPGFLRQGRFERYLYAVGLNLDVLAEKMVLANRMRMPTLCDPTALPIIGQDRLIPAGLTQLEAGRRQTLKTAFAAWQTAGTPWAILRQTLMTLLELRPAARLVSTRYDRSFVPAHGINSNWDSLDEDVDATAQQPTHLRKVVANWDWDSINYARGAGDSSRFWFVIESVGSDAWCTEDTSTWDDAETDLWDDNETIAWGTTDCDASVFDALWAAILLWKDENAECVALIVSFDASHFAPTQAAGGGLNPDGHYGRWSEMSGTAQVAARTSISNCIFSHRIQ